MLIMIISIAFAFLLAQVIASDIGFFSLQDASGTQLLGGPQNHWVQVTSWNFDNAPQGSRIGGPKAIPTSFTFEKILDSASNKIFIQLANQKSASTGTLVVKQKSSSGAPLTNGITYTFHQMYLESVSIGNAEGGEIPMETVTLEFESVTTKHNAPSTTSDGGTSSLGWNLVNNAKRALEFAA